VNSGGGGGLMSGIVEFLAMGGHGLYVWLSYGAAVAVVLYDLVSVRWRERRWVREYRDRALRHGTGPANDSNRGVADS